MSEDPRLTPKMLEAYNMATKHGGELIRQGTHWTYQASPVSEDTDEPAWWVAWATVKGAIDRGAFIPVRWALPVTAMPSRVRVNPGWAQPAPPEPRTVDLKGNPLPPWLAVVSPPAGEGHIARICREANAATVARECADHTRAINLIATAVGGDVLAASKAMDALARDGFTVSKRRGAYVPRGRR